MKKLLILAFVAMMALPGAVFAQKTATQATKPAAFQLTVAVNPGNAAIFIDGAQIKGNVATVAAGNHTIMTKAPGYLDFTTTVSVNGNMTLPVTMQGANAQLTIAVNPGNATIFIDGAQIKGNVASVKLGSHTISTKAPGYLDFTTAVSVNGNMTLPVTMQRANFQLTIAVNPGNAAIFIDGAQIKGNMASVTPGAHMISTKAPGYLDFTTAVSVTGNMTLPVTMQMANFQLTVAVNPSNATIFVDGTQIKGNQASVTPGNHMVMTKAPGFLDFTTQVSVTSPMVLPVTMQLASAQLTLAVNPGNAAIFVDGAQIKGTVATVTLGNHTVMTKAAGYLDFTTSVSVNDNMVLPIMMQPSMGTVSIVLPAAGINTDLKGGHWSQIQVYVDGVMQKTQGGQMIPLAPGKRLIKITSGGLQVEGFYDIQAGINYTFEPFMGLNLKQ